MAACRVNTVPGVREPVGVTEIVVLVGECAVRVGGRNPNDQDGQPQAASRETLPTL